MKCTNRRCAANVLDEWERFFPFLNHIPLNTHHLSMSCTHLMCSLYCTCLLSRSLALTLALSSRCRFSLYSVFPAIIFSRPCVYLESPLFLMSRLLFVCLSVAVIIPCFFLLLSLLKRLGYSYVRSYIHGTLRMCTTFFPSSSLLCVSEVWLLILNVLIKTCCVRVCVRLPLCEPNRFHSDNIMNVTVIWILPWSLIHYRMWI